MNISNILQELSTKIPNKTAIIDTKNSTRISFNYLEKNSSKIANMFSEAGLTEGDRVLLFVPVSVELYSILTAIFKMKLVAVFLDDNADSRQIKKCCEEHLPKAFITSNKKSGLAGYFNKEMRKIPNKYILNGKIPYFKEFEEYENCSDKFVPLDIDSETGALIEFIKENNGNYETLIKTQDSLITQQKVLEKLLKLDQSHKTLVLFPIFILLNIFSGVTSIIPNVGFKDSEYVDVNEIFGQITNESIDTIIAPPAFFDTLIDIYNKTGRNVHSIKKIITIGLPVFPGTLEYLKKIFPYAEIKAIYGLSESELIAELHYNDITQEDIENLKQGRGLLAGKIIEDIELKIIKNTPKNIPEDEAKILGSGEKGEIIVSGSYIPNKINDKSNMIKIGNKIWYRTGEIGYLDKQKRLWLLGKSEAEISKNDEKIYPFTVETILSFEREIKRTALLEKENKVFLFIEMIYNNNEEQSEVQEKIEKRVKELEIKTDNIIFIDKIPIDKKYNERIDYYNLRKLAEKYS